MSERLSAAAIHLLTATGAAFALLALIAASRGDWQWMFVWLGVALIVDTVDGPLARRVGVTRVLPRFSGERLDLIVDFLTYVAVPAFALSQSDLLPEAFRLPAGIAVILSSLFHMADQESKTKDGYFVGFPAIWNVVCLYLFALMPAPLGIAFHRGVFRRADFRADPHSASLPRRETAHLLRDRCWPMGRGRHRGRRQPFSIAAMGKGTADRNRNLPHRRRRPPDAPRRDGPMSLAWPCTALTSRLFDLI